MSKKIENKFIDIVSYKYKQYKEKYSEHSLRLKEEVSFIARNKTLLQDFLDMVDEEGPTGDTNEPNSLVAYILGITKKEPDLTKDFRYDFKLDDKNKRASPPDIDIDFESREPVLKYVAQKYGQDRVSLIGTNIVYKAKAAVQNCAKALNVANSYYDPDAKKFTSENDQEAKRISKIIPSKPDLSIKQWLGEEKIDEDDINQRVRNALIQIQEEARKHPEVFEAAKKIEGMTSYYGVHAAGVVISSEDVTNDIPLQVSKMRSEDKETAGDFLKDEVSEVSDWMSTQFTMDEVEEIGLLKFDFLVIDTIKKMSLTEKLIKERHNIDVDVNKLEPNDSKVFKTISDLKLEGLFQASGKAFMSIWEKYNNYTGKVERDKKTNKIKLEERNGLIEAMGGCSNFEDLSASNALVRPGCIRLQMHEDYRRGKENPSLIRYPHPLLEDILKSTYGKLCLSGDTEIYDNKSGIFLKLKDAYGKKIDIQSQDKKNNEIILKNREIIYNGKKELIRLWFDDGSFVDLTKDHKIFTEEDGMIESVKSLNKYACFSKKLITKEEKAHNIDTARFLGMLLGDGILTKHAITLCCKTKKYMSFFKEKISSEFPGSFFNDYFHCRCFYSNVNSGKSGKTSEILKFTRDIGIQGTTSKTKKIPAYIYNSSFLEKVNFILGYFDTDGHIGISKKNALEVSFKTVNKKLAYDFKKLLLSIGFHSHLYFHKNAIQIDIDEKYKFIKDILYKSDSLKKEEIIHIYQKIESKRRRQGKNTFSRKNLLNEIKEKYNKSFRKISEETGISRPNFFRTKKRIKESSLNGLNGLYSLQNFVMKKVVKIENIGIKDCYDILNCGDKKRFTISNGLIVSNCYQEQLTDMVQKMAGFSYAEADKIRKACAKKKPEILDEMKPKFFKGCENNGIEKKVSSEMWDIVVEFGKYSFNRAHCCSYAFICYLGAWLKTYYPTEFICATLTSKASKSDEDLEISIEKFRHEYPNLKVSPPNVNLSKNFYYPAGDLEVVAPLMSLKGVGEKISRRIIENQKYLSIPDFLARSGANKRAIEIFLEVGALCDFGEKEKVREEILSYNRLMKNVTGGAKVKDTGVSSIF